MEIETRLKAYWFMGLARPTKMLSCSGLTSRDEMVGGPLVVL